MRKQYTQDRYRQVCFRMLFLMTAWSLAEHILKVFELDLSILGNGLVNLIHVFHNAGVICFGAAFDI